MSHSNPLVSIIMPAYQAEKTIGAALSSCLTQTYPNIEVVVTNDGSTDRTSEIAHAHGVTVIDQENRGLSKARNRAIAEAKGDLVFLCDSDDLILPPAIESMVDLYQENGGGKTMVTSQAYFLTPGGLNPKRTVFPMQHPPLKDQRLTLLHANWLTIFTLFPRQMIDEVGGFDPDLKSCEDWDLWLRGVFAGYQVLRQPKAHCIYRWTGGSMSTQRPTMYAAEDLTLTKLRDREEAAGTLREEEREYLDLRLSAGSPRRLVGLGEEALREGRYDEAKKHFDNAVRLAPSSRKLQVRARTMQLPGGPQAWSARLRRIDREVGMGESMRR